MPPFSNKQMHSNDPFPQTSINYLLTLVPSSQILRAIQYPIHKMSIYERRAAEADVNDAAKKTNCCVVLLQLNLVD